MRNRVNSTRILIFLFIAALIFIPGRFALGNLDVLKSRAADIHEEADRLDSQAAKAQSQVLDNPDSFKARESKADTAIPVNTSIPTVIDKLSKEASAAGLVWLSGTPTEVPPPKGVGGSTAISASLAAVDGSSGDAFITNVENFLDRVRELDRLVTVERLSVSPTDSSANIQLVFFSQEKS